MQNNNPGFAWPLAIIVIIAMAAVGAGYYFYSQQSADHLAESMMDDLMTGQEAMMDDDQGALIMENNDAMMEDGGAIMADDRMMEESGEMTTSYQGQLLAGQASPLLDFNQSDYEAALASDKLVVLYFYANWCPVCREETAAALYPAFNGLTTDQVVGFRVNYNDNQTDDDEVALARQYGIAYQHSKVFLRAGARLLKSPESWNLARYNEEINNYLN